MAMSSLASGLAIERDVGQDLNQMTVPSRNRIRNLSPGDLRPNTLPLDYGGSPQQRIFASGREINVLLP